jgi:hypothetical protein
MPSPTTSAPLSIAAWIDRYRCTWPTLSVNADKVLTSMMFESKHWHHGHHRIDTSGWGREPVAASWQEGIEAHLRSVDTGHPRTAHDERSQIAWASQPGLSSLPHDVSPLLLFRPDAMGDGALPAWSHDVEQAWHRAVDLVMAYDLRSLIRPQRPGIMDVDAPAPGSPVMVNRTVIASECMAQRLRMWDIHACITSVHERKGWAIPDMPAWASRDEAVSIPAIATAMERLGIDVAPVSAKGSPLTPGFLEPYLHMDHDSDPYIGLHPLWEPYGDVSAVIHRAKLPHAGSDAMDRAQTYLRRVETVALALFPGDGREDPDITAQRCAHHRHIMDVLSDITTARPSPSVRSG